MHRALRRLIAVVALVAPAPLALAVAEPVQNLTQGTGHFTIQDAIVGAFDLDEIEVQPGVYAERLDFQGKAIRVRGASPDPRDTIIDGQGLGPVVTFMAGEGPDSVLEGFTLMNGSAPNGGGVACFMASPTILRCVFQNNVATSNCGGGLFNMGGAPTVAGCLFSRNTAPLGAGLADRDGAAVVTNCVFHENFAFLSAGAIHVDGPMAATTVANTICWRNAPQEVTNNGASLTIGYSNLMGGLGAVAGAFPVDAGGNIDADPGFIDPFGQDGIPGTLDDDLRLAPGSPCIDAGDNAATGVPLLAADLAGAPRLRDDPATPDTGVGNPPVIDMGVHEFQPVVVGPTFLRVPADVATIQQAIAMIADDASSVIEVEPGTYLENIDTFGKAFTLRSASGDPADTVLDGGGADSVVRIESGEGPDTVIEGFTITNGTANDGGGVLVENAGPTLRRCDIIGNVAFGAGGGLAGRNAATRVVDCRFLGNTAFEGGGIYNEIGPLTVVNSLFSGNMAEEGGGLSNRAAAINVTNTTFASNTANLSGGGIISTGPGDPLVENTILWFNFPDQVASFSSPIRFGHCNIEGGLPPNGLDQGGNLSADPLFVDPLGADGTPGTTDDDVRLAVPSPSIDAGSNAAVGLAGISTDLDGDGRFFDVPSVPDTGIGPPPVVDMGPYENQTSVGGGDVTVPTDFATIQEAIDAVPDDPASTIVVLPGTYNERIDLRGKALTLRSYSGDPADTIIDGGHAGPVVTIIRHEGEDTVISGFSIVNGRAAVGGGADILNASPTFHCCVFRNNFANAGGGMYVASGAPRIVKCIFVGNTGMYAGGGIYSAGGGAVIVNTLFNDNDAPLGGGLYAASSSPEIYNTSFVDNTSEIGGGIAAASAYAMVVANSILRGNTPEQIVNLSWMPNIAYGSSGAPRVSHSNVMGGLYAGLIDGGGNIDQDPAFVDPVGPDGLPGTPDDDFRLGPGSPSIDAGDSGAEGLLGITVDLAGEPRFFDDPATPDTGVGPPPIVDMGPYEFQGSVRIVACACDADADGDTDVADFAVFASAFQSSAGSPRFSPGADFSGDGVVDVYDFSMLAAEFGCRNEPALNGE